MERCSFIECMQLLKVDSEEKNSYKSKNIKMKSNKEETYIKQI